MKSNTKLIVIFSVLFAVIAVVTSVTTAMVYAGKKKNEQLELERYLDGSIL